jgi:hypothetical protein
MRKKRDEEKKEMRKKQRDEKKSVTWRNKDESGEESLLNFLHPTVTDK